MQKCGHTMNTSFLILTRNISSRHQEFGIRLSGLTRTSFSYISMIKFRFSNYKLFHFFRVIVHSPVHHFWQFWFVICSVVLNDVFLQMGPIYFSTFAFCFYAPCSFHVVSSCSMPTGEMKFFHRIRLHKTIFLRCRKSIFSTKTLKRATQV